MKLKKMLTENGIRIDILSQADMSNYPNLPTPPSSNEDSPQSINYNSPLSSFSPNDMHFQMQPSFGVNRTIEKAPLLKIIEQPIERFRFRYKSEMTGTHGSLCGQNSDRTRKLTYPTVELCNYDGRALIRCSIYQHNTLSDHKPHAHRLIKKKGRGEVDDPHDVYVTSEDKYVHTFHNMGIIHTAKKNLESELTKKKIQLKREEIARIEGAYRDLNIKEEVEIKGLAASESKSINLNVVCLRFDAFAIYNNDGILRPICPPVYSHSINNLKSALTGELKIVRMDHCTSPAKGNKEIFILVERVTKKNVKIRFYELDDENGLVWEDYGRFSDLDVHHQYAIVFKTPPYRDLNINKPVRVFIELERPSDHNTSEPKEFTYTPNPNTYHPGAKRARSTYDSYDSSMSSNELPLTIKNLNIDAAFDTLPAVTSAELEAAMNNIDSEEFNELFSEYKDEYVSLDTDSPIPKMFNKQSKSKNAKLSRSGNSDFLQAQLAVQELTKFLKTDPSKDKAVQMLKYYLSTENKTNALHASIKNNDKLAVMLLLKMIYIYEQNELINVRNEDLETPLHIAVAMKNVEVVSNLVVCKANVNLVNEDSNTPLHLAVLCDVPTTIFEKLISSKNCEINFENYDGNTAFDLAIENGNLRAVKLLCSNGADVNRRHNKQGYTPLRNAIEKENIEIVHYLLQRPDIDPLIKDFNQIDALQASFKKQNEQLLVLIKDYMQKHEIPDMDIKSEVEDVSEDEMEEKFQVKVEQVSHEELLEMYTTVRNFTPECLAAIAKILDRNGTWENLAELLDMEYFKNTGLADTKSPTQKLLKIAIENGDTVLQIREFLDNLDEFEAVQIIDKMVKEQSI